MEGGIIPPLPRKNRPSLLPTSQKFVWVRQLIGVVLLLGSLTGLVNALAGTGVRLHGAQQVARRDDMDILVAYFSAGATEGGELLTAVLLIALTVGSILIGILGYRLTTNDEAAPDSEVIPKHREGEHTGLARSVSGPIGG